MKDLSTRRACSVRVRAGLAGAILAIAALAGCGDDGQSAQERYCEAGESLRTSVGSLADLDLIAEGTAGLESALEQVRDDVDELRGAASDAVADEIEALEESIDEFGDALSALGGEISTDNVSAVVTAVQNVDTAARNVYSTLADCP